MATRTSAAMLRAACLLPLAIFLGSWSAGVNAQTRTCWTVDTNRSELIVHVRPAGLLAARLHAHRLVPTEWQGRACFDPEQPETLEFELTVAADSLEDRQPDLSEEDVQQVERQVAGPEVLDSARYGEIRYAADRLTVDRKDAGSLTATLHGELSLHGQTRRVDVPVTARWNQERLRAGGEVDLKQSDYGIEPYSRFLGAVSVEDRITIEFAIDAIPVDRGPGGR